MSARFDLNGTIKEAIERARAEGVPIEILAEPGSIPEVSGRSAEIREVITNLVANAVDALPEGGRIVVATRAEAGRVIVSVNDSGVGMPDEVMRRAFEPFFTTKGVKRTGLGLALAYGTVQRHGGEISLESAPGQGTTVTFWLPAAETAADDRGASPSRERRGAVLVIDDEADIRDLVAESLTSRGHQITVAAGGREGLARFAAGHYDVVVTDLSMPDLDGWEVARAIKSSRGETPVLLLTGMADADLGGDARGWSRRDLDDRRRGRACRGPGSGDPGLAPAPAGSLLVIIHLVFASRSNPWG
jgi:CheY-like chemotaxis protein/anti-sigma regulatory factor (Ser/Thr protein kinase)